MKFIVFLSSITLMTFSLYGDLSQETAKASDPDVISRLYVGGYGGYGAINGMYGKDGQYAQFRFGLGVDAIRLKTFTLGFESAIQSGNTMRASMNLSLQDEAGGLPLQVVLKPFLDLLLALRWNFITDFHFIVKGGVAYRELQFIDRSSSKDSLRKLNGEFQFGFGYQLNPRTRLVAFYQGIYSKNSLRITLSDDEDLYIHHIPTQQAGLVGIEYSF